MMQISELLEQQDIKAIDSNGNTLIHLVIKNEEFSLKETLESLEILLDRGVDPNIKNKNEESVLHLAVARRNKDVIDFLITRKVQYDDSIAEYMIRNEKENFDKLLDDLQISDSDMQKENSESASFFDWIIAKELFDIDSVNNDGESALILALNFHLLHLLPVLLKYTKNINYVEPDTDRTLLHIFLDNNASVRQSYGASNFSFHEINKCRLYPNYIQRHAIDVVEAMLNNGISLDIPNVVGNTALHVATSKEENIEIIKMLIENSADVNQKNSFKETPFYTVFSKLLRLPESQIDEQIRLSQTDIIKKLVECGANINCKNSSGETALSYLAIYNQQINVRSNYRVYALSEDGDIVDISATHRDSKLMKNIEMLELLLKYGADFSTKVNSGYSILHMALLRDYNQNRREKPPISPHELPSLNECVQEYPSYEVEFLLNHWIKIKVANIKCNTGVEYADLMKKEEYKMVDQKCRNEIKILKDTFIDSRTTLYTLLHMDVNSRRAYINNEKLKNILQSPKFEEEYPEYSVLIFARYQEALTRKSLMDPAKNAWLELTNIQLPDICVELIYSFLSNVELFDFIEGI